ncbi:1,4-Dihydroxy-2-naphthoic acid (DHNA)-octaprenyltransferase [Blattabacterium sp. (Mastotermes darwiniensis) str. MADAR]|uniref:1,4-dihydroxy-2-naphthoate octaprenyltransferase n=1 Tax=Blattabacterium sp. (Mastotermes darwiniensis) TaxID=39768 RepID=UPI000231DE54|nr:1,4-dihydroxy-2-naphthoate octaprenyltransferase [Blattabacterium sp. (Mastotermes darwiniensis)]AER40648.1 1,4-Dihydroxy-2-naphthoic acid (DHNA)-octaprenyltransferase [Blattabacterium sp. (Mastotermes darwiniensis) str. MADAR]
MRLKYWFCAVRSQTLLLSFSGITLSYLISISKGYGDFYTYLLCIITSIFLQVLANFSNDYGDSIKGVDNYQRIGPKRTIQSGLISIFAMKKAINILSILSFCSGLLLIYRSIELNNFFFFFFYFIGIFVCIYSSIKYSVGPYPYGYLGMGDLSVFIFFGLVSVGGSYFLYTKVFSLDIFLLSLSIGLLSLSVLNINNMRDIKNDYKNGKYTVAGILGIKYAKLYHIFSIIISIVLGIFFNILNDYKNIYKWLFFILNIPFFIRHLKRIISIENPECFNSELKRLIHLTFLYSMSIGIGAQIK